MIISKNANVYLHSLYPKHYKYFGLTRYNQKKDFVFLPDERVEIRFKCVPFVPYLYQKEAKALLLIY